MSKTNIAILESSSIIVEGLQKIIENSPEFKVTKVFRSYSFTHGIALPSVQILIVNPRLFGEFNLAKQVQDWKNENESLHIFAIVSSYLSAKSTALFDGVIELEEDPSSILSKLRNYSEIKSNSSAESCDLSQREKEVLVLVAKGFTNKEIADQLNISIHTAIAHRKNITSKTNIKSISGLTIYALLNNLISQDEIR
ncbi:MAG: response regulator transcription factor [Paludibacteraceae bacterium]|nr:response regulator transcription factor [Paludibacteraceae bacterium]MBR5973506.1 response regulator transcription factor [Paludibacteraceae bacterium]